MKLYEDDREMVDDIMLSTNELIEQCNPVCEPSSISVRLTDVIATNNLNKIFKRLTSIAIFLAIPTVMVDSGA